MLDLDGMSLSSETWRACKQNLHEMNWFWLLLLRPSACQIIFLSWSGADKSRNEEEEGWSCSCYLIVLMMNKPEDRHRDYR